MEPLTLLLEYCKAAALGAGHRVDLVDLPYYLLPALDKNEPAQAARIFENYRKRFADMLSPADRQRLEELIRECRRRSAKSS